MYHPVWNDWCMANGSVMLACVTSLYRSQPVVRVLLNSHQPLCHCWMQSVWSFTPFFVIRQAFQGVNCRRMEKCCNQTGLKAVVMFRAISLGDIYIQYRLCINIPVLLILLILVPGSVIYRFGNELRVVDCLLVVRRYLQSIIPSTHRLAFSVFV